MTSTPPPWWSTWGRSATSCSTRCTPGRCSTRWRSSSRPRPQGRSGGLGHARRAGGGLRADVRAGAEGPAAHVAGPLVADVRPRPDHELTGRQRRAGGRRRAPAAAVHGAGRDHGHRGRVGAGRARAAQSRRGRFGGLAHRAAGLQCGAPGALPPRAEHGPRVGRAVAPHRREVRPAQRDPEVPRDHGLLLHDWIWGPTALFPEEEPQMFTEIPLESVREQLPA